MANETLSVKQANRIIDKSNEVLAKCNSELNTKCNDFLKNLSTIWEDTNAVKFSKDFDKTHTDLVNNLNKNNDVFASTIRDISDMYVKAGSMKEKVSSIARKLSGKLNSAVVKEHFSGSENADDFGFLDISSGPQKVVDELEKLKSAMNKISSEMVAGMNSISAFGNVNVSLAITKSAGSMIDIVRENMEKIAAKAKEHLEETAKVYSNVGSNSVTAAAVKIGAEAGAAAAGAAAAAAISGLTGGSASGSTSSNSSGGTGGTPIQTKYAPPSPSSPSGSGFSPSSGSGSSSPIQTKYAPPTGSTHGTGSGSGTAVPIQTKYAPPTGGGTTTPIQTKYAPPTMFKDKTK